MWLQFYIIISITTLDNVGETLYNQRLLSYLFMLKYNSLNWWSEMEFDSSLFISLFFSQTHVLFYCNSCPLYIPNKHVASAFSGILLNGVYTYISTHPGFVLGLLWVLYSKPDFNCIILISLIGIEKLSYYNGKVQSTRNNTAEKCIVVWNTPPV